MDYYAISVFSLLLGFSVGVFITAYLCKLIKHRDVLRSKLFTLEFDLALNDIRFAINYKYQMNGQITKEDLKHLSKIWHKRYTKVAFIIEHHEDIYKVTIKNKTGVFVIIGHYTPPNHYITENWIYGV